MTHAKVGFSMRAVDELPDDEYARFVLDCAELGLVMGGGERNDLSHAVRVLSKEVFV